MHRVKFTAEEDAKLKAIMEFFTKKPMKINWYQVSLYMGNKNSRQCKDRWTNYLREGLNMTEFTPEENYMLLCKVEEMGKSWRKISKLFNNRTENAIKSQYKRLIRRNATKENVFLLNMEKAKKNNNENKLADDFNEFVQSSPNVHDEFDHSFEVPTDYYEDDEFLDLPLFD